jgi:heavy metal sensor kinase
VIQLRPKHLRTRLALWYLALLAGILAIFIVGSVTYLFFNLRRELDDYLAERVEDIEQVLSLGQNGRLEVGHMATRQDPDRARELCLEIRDLDGSILYRNDQLGDTQLGGTPLPDEGRYTYSPRSAKLPNGQRIRLASRVDFVEGHPVLIRLGTSEEPLWHDFNKSTGALVAAFPLALLIAGFVAFSLAKRSLAPIGAMARRAEQITAESLGERLPVENPADELGHLARVFNDTLARLESSFERLRRFTADASHELRTPLTAIRSVGEVGLQQGGDAHHYREAIGSMLEEVNRLTLMVENLLTISRADSGHVQLERSHLPLLDLAREAQDLLADLAEEKNQSLIVEGDHQAVVLADRLILRHAVMNVIDNSIKYSPAGTPIKVRVKQIDCQCILDVIDKGPGIPAEDRERIFDRFYRLDKARSREAGGAGLGLSIARWAVEAHSGTLRALANAHRGSTFRFILPAAESLPDTTREKDIVVLNLDTVLRQQSKM